MCLPVSDITETVEGSSTLVRHNQGQEQIRYRLLVLKRLRIDQ